MIYVRKVGPYVVHARQPDRRILKVLLMFFLLILLVVLTFKILDTDPYIKLKLLNEGSDYSVKKSILLETSSPRGKCGLPKPCPVDHFAFKIFSGAANAIGPEICFDGEILIGRKAKALGVGINIAVVNGQTGKLINADSFDMWGGDVEPLIEFLTSIKNGSLVLMASYDDPATRLNDEARTLISQLGSSHISTLGFRDNWIFVGEKGIKSIKPLEKHIKNEKAVNKYDNWPEMIEMEGCVPRKQN